MRLEKLTFYFYALSAFEKYHIPMWRHKGHKYLMNTSTQISVNMTPLYRSQAARNKDLKSV